MSLVRPEPAVALAEAGPASALIVHNPRAGRRHARRIVQRVAGGLQRAGWEVEIEQTAYGGHATILAAQAVRAGCSLAIAAGGDGTINEVVQALVGSETTLAAIPVGTVNVWAREAGLLHHPELLAHAFARATVRRIDVGRFGERYFLLMAGLGFDAAIVGGVAPALKRTIGRWAYLMRGAALARSYAGVPTTVVLDGVALRCTLLMMVIGNTRRYAGFLRVTPSAIADDGELDVCLIRGHHVWEGAGQAGLALRGRTAVPGRLLRVRARHIEVWPERPLAVQLDGEFAGFTPASVHVVPRSLKVLAAPGSPGGLFSAEV